MHRKHFRVLMQHFKKMRMYWRTHLIPSARSTAFLAVAILCWNSHSAVFQSRQK